MFFLICSKQMISSNLCSLTWGVLNVCSLEWVFVKIGFLKLVYVEIVCVNIDFIKTLLSLNMRTLKLCSLNRFRYNFVVNIIFVNIVFVNTDSCVDFRKHFCNKCTLIFRDNCRTASRSQSYSHSHIGHLHNYEFNHSHSHSHGYDRHSRLHGSTGVAVYRSESRYQT